MHELKLVKELAEKALEIVKSNKVKRVKKIFVKIGAGSHLTPESFTKLFREFSKSTLLERAEIVISTTEEEGLILESMDVET